jgi:hypothetical protein
MFSSRRSHLALLTVVGALVAAAATAPGASAATQRYASPSGSGTSCDSAHPCDILQAVNSAAAGDEVIVRPGNYLLAATLNNTAAITIHGVAGEPRPIVLFTGPNGASLHDSTLRYMEIVQGEPTLTALVAWKTTLDQVIVRGGSTADCAAATANSTVRNSIFVARSANGSAICAGSWQNTNTSSYRNVTAIAQDGPAIEAHAGGTTGNTTLNVVNVIARTAKGLGLWAHTDSSGAHATILVTNTNYHNYLTSGADAIVAAGSGNQDVAPTFVNAAAGDYRQSAGSVTIDAGHYDPANTLDVDGDPRNVGPPDIGADEYVVPPTATTNPATALTDAGATLAGSVDPKRAPTSYRFEYGTTTAYGKSTAAADAGSGSGSVAVGAPVNGLAPATTYHYRVVASNAAGVAYGGDRTFTTAPTGATGTPGTPGSSTPSAGGFAGVKLVSTKLAYARRSITLRLSCPASTAGNCTGRTKLTARHRSSGSRSATVVKLGRARFQVAPGKVAKVKVRVTRAGRRLFAGTRRLRGRAASAAHDGAGLSKTTVAAVRIRKGTG